MEIRERDGGELVSVPVVHVTDFTITKGKIERHKRRERGKERGSCLVSAPQPLSQPLWEIDRTPSVCQARLHTKPQTITAACLSLSYNHTNKQTNKHTLAIYETQVARLEKCNETGNDEEKQIR